MRAARPVYIATVAVLLLTHSTAPSAHAECIGIDPREMSRLAAVVLEGTVRKVVQPYPAIAELTVDVHQVWKGTVSREAVFFLERQNIDSPKVKVGDRRVFVAGPESTPLEGSRRMFLFSCGGAETPTREIVSKLGHARTPR